MTDIKVLMKITPRYGETLLGIGGIMLSIGDSVLREDSAREEIGEYLIGKECPYGDISLLILSSIWKILDKYTGGKRPIIAVIRNAPDKKGEIPVQLELLKFFKEKVFPVLVRKYAKELDYNRKYITYKIRIAKGVYSNFYSKCVGTYNISEVFFQEFKELLLYNCIVISDCILDGNDDMKFELLLPIPPVMKI